MAKLTQLEAVRGFAAAYVVLHHARLAANEGIGKLLYFGQEAVILFFLLSGFVIQYSVTSRSSGRPDRRTYLVHRARRIFPLLLFSLLAAYVAASIQAGRPASPHWPDLLGNICMLQDVSGLKRGVWFDTYQGNSPLWSLSYEWWFYMLFVPLGLDGSNRPGRANLAAAALAVAGFISYQAMPNQISLFAGYFIIWWAGAQLARQYRATGDVTLAGQAGTLLPLALCALLWCIPVLRFVDAGVPLRLGTDPVLQARHFGFALMAVCLGVLWRKGGLRYFGWTFGPFRVLAPISYSLYLLHVPFLQVVEGLGIAAPAYRLAIAGAALIPVCYLLEVRLQPLVNGWIDSVIAPPSKSPGLAEY